jgi:hypothetical protein
MSRARLTHYKIKPDDLLDLIDGYVEANAGAILVRCPGGRLIRDGYMCGHCGKDPSEVIEKDGKRYRSCGSPAKRVVATTDLMTMIPVMIEEG